MVNMRKTIVVWLAVLVFLCAPAAYSQAEQTPAGTDAAAFESYASAATEKALFARHRNVVMQDAYYGPEALDYACAVYADSQAFVFRYDDGLAQLLRRDILLVRHTENGLDSAFYTVYLYDRQEDCESLFLQLYEEDYIIVPETAVLLEAAVTDDGAFTALNEVTDPEAIRREMEKWSSMAGLEPEAGTALRCAYRFDTETKDLLHLEMYLTGPDGAIHPIYITDFTYDAAPYGSDPEDDPFAEYFAALADPAKTRRVTVTFRPDTGEEHTETYTLPLGAKFRIRVKKAAAEAVYTDRACTQAFGEEDGTGDLELYVP